MVNDIEIPYFMENEEWFYYDNEKEIYILTEKAPEKARRSYYEYYSENDIDL